MKVIASSLRKGNIVEIDGKLGVIVSTENIHPGKGTPVTQMDVRRIADGVKVSLRFKTTEQVERAFVEDRNYNYLYSDGDGHHFMNTDTYDQVQVPDDVIGDQKQWLQEGMKVMLSIFNEIAVAIQLPPRVTLEIVEWRAHHGAAAYFRWNARRHPDRRRFLRRTRERLTPTT